MLQKVAMHGDVNKLYACEIRRSDQFERKVGGGYNEAEFQQHPERYISTFAHKYAPYSSVIVNGIKTTTHSLQLNYQYSFYLLFISDISNCNNDH